MIKYVLLSENKENKEDYENIIDRIMIKIDMYYEVHKYEVEKEEFKKLCEDNCGTNIFIIEDSEEINAERLVRLIKNEYKMVAAFIIIIGKKDKSKLNSLVFDHSFLIDIIKNNEELKDNLENDIKRILDILCGREQSLNVINDKLLYRIPYKDIYYIEKELYGKKAIIVTKFGEFHIYKSLNSIEEVLDERFYRSHQSAIINIDNVKVFDFKENKIIFTEDIVCPLLSRSFKKQARKVLTKV